MSRSGSAFTSANTETWSYNAKGEVVSADHSTNDLADRAYQFDSIGNRIQAADGLDLAAPSAISYTANSLNQYSTVGATVRSFDDDGNLIDDGTKQYLWDAENRLLSVKQGATTLAEFEYDYQSRRISKTADGSNVTFVYEGWNPIAEYVDGTLSKSYTWGMDLSGSMQGAGGVGGLMSVNDGSATYYPTYDGNGNISEYLDASGAVVAHYEHDTFGRTVVQSGAKANNFSHQFSTKQRDAETGLYYYGYRYYDALNGRWLGRDPIEEEGGFNVYWFIGNDPINYIDKLGLVRCNKQNVGKKIWQNSNIVVQGVKKPRKGMRTHDAIPRAIFKWKCKECKCKVLFGYAFYYKSTVDSGKETIGGAVQFMFGQSVKEKDLIRDAKAKIEELKQKCFQ